MTKDLRVRAAAAARTLILMSAISFVPTACGEAEAAPPTLSNAYGSPDALAEAVLHAIRHEDRDALDALRVTQEEHRQYLWEELPESQHVPFDFAWGLNDANSRKGIDQVMAAYGGTDFELVSIVFTRSPETYSTFTVHFGTELRVRRLSDGQEGVLPILDVVLERGGEWKLMNVEEQ
jgi:hypothetical protein